MGAPPPWARSVATGALEMAAQTSLRGRGGALVGPVETGRGVCEAVDASSDPSRRAPQSSHRTSCVSAHHHHVVPVLGSMGVDVRVVEAQQPDGGVFGTVKSANPESPPALDLGRALAESTDADVVIANDPDADRVGALARPPAR